MCVFRTFAASMVALALFAGPSMAASGTALGVKPQAEADTAGNIRVLTVGADIFIGDNVTTGPKGQVQIKFSDETELVVGPNSALLIEDYLLRSDQSVGRFAINALSGTFRFATGVSDHDKYVIKTPTGTIGVRGTEFDFTVGGGETQVLLYNGEVLLCNTDRKCVTLNDSCQIGVYDPSESTIVGNVDNISGRQRQELRAAFMYARSQMPLLREFRFEEALHCFNPGLRSGPMASLAEGTSDGSSVVINPDPEPGPDTCSDGGHGQHRNRRHRDEDD